MNVVLAPCEISATDITQVPGIHMFDLLVTCQLPFPVEAAATDLTDEQMSTMVYPMMVYHVAVVSDLFATMVTVQPPPGTLPYPGYLCHPLHITVLVC